MENDLAFMKGVPNIVSYWQQQKCDVFAMIRQLGQPTIFLTLSASELHWPHLLLLLERLQKSNPDLEIDPADMHALYRANLVNNDPVVCALYFNRLVCVFLSILQHRKFSPLVLPYRVVDFFERIEFQHRGSAHRHILLWLEGTANEDLSADMPETIHMASKLRTLDTTILKREHAQEHQRTHTCLKENATRRHFEAPFWPSDRPVIIILFQPPPQDDKEELVRRERLKEKFMTMHQALEATNYDNMQQFWQQHDVHSEQEYMTYCRRA